MITIAFVLSIFMLFEIIANQDGSYLIVTPLRIGYAISWLGICLLVYRSKLNDYIKAMTLACSYTVFMTANGVQLSEFKGYLIIFSLIFILIIGIAIIFLVKLKMKWYHYYAIFMSIIAALLYVL